MSDLNGLLIVLGAVLIVLGIYLFKHPDFLWNISPSRRWFLKGGEPTELYYSTQKINSIVYIFLGITMIILSISMFATEKKGYVVEIDDEPLKIPCYYSDIYTLGYRIDPEEEIKILRTTTKNLKDYCTYIVKNDKGKEIKITFENRGDTDLPATECELIAINVQSENGPKIVLPNKVEIGMSEKDVKSIMGHGTPRGIAGSAAEYKSTINFDTYKINIVYTGTYKNKQVTSIRVEDVFY